MKTTLTLFAALAIGGAAIAQDAQPTPASPPATPPMPAPAADPAAPAPAPTTDPAAAPGNTMPSGSSGMSTPGAGAAAGSTDTSNYPMCSRSVTDHCVQHEGHRMMRRPR